MGMERTLWTDERIDDMVERIEKRFDDLERRMDRLEGEVSALRRELHQMMLVMLTGYLTLAGIMLAHWA